MFSSSHNLMASVNIYQPIEIVCNSQFSNNLYMFNYLISMISVVTVSIKNIFCKTVIFPRLNHSILYWSRSASMAIFEAYVFGSDCLWQKYVKQGFHQNTKSKYSSDRNAEIYRSHFVTDSAHVVTCKHTDESHSLFSPRFTLVATRHTIILWTCYSDLLAASNIQYLVPKLRTILIEPVVPSLPLSRVHGTDILSCLATLHWSHCYF